MDQHHIMQKSLACLKLHLSKEEIEITDFAIYFDIPAKNHVNWNQAIHQISCQ